MKRATACASLFLLMAASPLASARADSLEPTLRVALQNASLQKHYFEAKDSLCDANRSTDCRVADLLANSAKCVEHRRAEECAAAREIAASPECQAGMLYHGWLDSGERVELAICADHTGKGRVATRNSETAPWVQHHWVEAGATIEVK